MRKYVKFIALVLLAAALLLWFGKGLDWAEVFAAVKRADWRLILAAVAVICTTYLTRAFRWRALLAPLTPSGLRELFAATTVGFSAVLLIGRAGEVVRPAFLPLRDPRVRPGASFITIMVERIYDMATVVVLFAVNLLWFQAPRGEAAEYARMRMAGLALLLVAIGGIGALIWYRRVSRPVIRFVEERLGRWRFVPNRLRNIVTGLLEQLARALSVLVNARELVVTVGWTVVLWGSVAVADWLVFRAFGLPFGLVETIFVMSWSLVGSMVPTPGGAAGAFHMVTAYGLIFLGVAQKQAAAASIVLHLVVFGPALLFGLYYFLRSDVSLARLRQLAAAGERESATPMDEATAASAVGESPNQARAVEV